MAEIYHNQNGKLFKQQFSIDAGHELARFIYDNIHIPLTTATTTAKTQQQQYRSENFNCLSETSSAAISNKTINTTNLVPTSARKIEELQQQQTSFNPALPAGTTTNISFLSSTDFRTMTTNEMKGAQEMEIFKLGGNKSPTTTTTATTTKTNASIIKKQKIILKKVSYICPTATWENSTTSSHTTRGNMDNDNESCAMYAEQTVNPVSTISCVSVRAGNVQTNPKAKKKKQYKKMCT